MQYFHVKEKGMKRRKKWFVFFAVLSSVVTLFDRKSQPKHCNYVSFSKIENFLCDLWIIFMIFYKIVVSDNRTKMVETGLRIN